VHICIYTHTLVIILFFGKFPLKINKDIYVYIYIHTLVIILFFGKFPLKTNKDNVVFPNMTSI
jgi:hypothetical protein